MILCFSSSVATGIGLLYCCVGAAITLVLARRAQPTATLVAALIAWPLLWPLVWSHPPRASTKGPLALAIFESLNALRKALDDPQLPLPPAIQDLQRLERSLLQADARIAAVDKLLQDPHLSEGPRLQASLEQLRQARRRAHAELESIISGLHQLRIQLGLHALAGDENAIGDQLAEFEARVSALVELSCWDFETPSP